MTLAEKFEKRMGRKPTDEELTELSNLCKEIDEYIKENYIELENNEKGEKK